MSEEVCRERKFYVDGVQLARLRYYDARAKFATGELTVREFLEARDKLTEAEAILAAHTEVYGARS